MKYINNSEISEAITIFDTNNEEVSEHINNNETSKAIIIFYTNNEEVGEQKWDTKTRIEHVLAMKWSS